MVFWGIFAITAFIWAAIHRCGIGNYRMANYPVWRLRIRSALCVTRLAEIRHAVALFQTMQTLEPKKTNIRQATSEDAGSATLDGRFDGRSESGPLMFENTDGTRSRYENPHVTKRRDHCWKSQRFRRGTERTNVFFRSGARSWAVAFEAAMSYALSRHDL